MSSKGAGLIKTVFNTDNVVMRISEKVLDLVTVNLLFVLSCLQFSRLELRKLVCIRPYLPLSTSVEFR